MRTASPGALIAALCWALSLREEALQARGPAAHCPGRPACMEAACVGSCSGAMLTYRSGVWYRAYLGGAQGTVNRLAAAGPARRLTLLFLHNALLARAAAALGAPKLASLLLPLVAADCPHMQCACMLSPLGMHPTAPAPGLPSHERHQTLP